MGESLPPHRDLSLLAQKPRWAETLKMAKQHSRELNSELNKQISVLESQGVSEREYRTRKRELVDAVEAKMEGHWRGYYRAFDTCNREYAKWYIR